MEQKGYFEATYFTLRILLLTGVIFFLVFIFGGLIAAFTCMLGFCFMLFANYDRAKFTLPFIFILISPLFMLYEGWRSVKKSKAGLTGAAINGSCIAFIPSFISNIPAWIFALLMPFPGILVAAEAATAGVIATFSGLILGALGGFIAMQKNKLIALVLTLVIFLTTSTILFNVGTSIRPELVADLTGGKPISNEKPVVLEYLEVIALRDASATEGRMVPVSGAKVDVINGSSVIETVYTNSDGVADFDAIFDPFIMKINISKEGYEKANIMSTYSSTLNGSGLEVYYAYLAPESNHLISEKCAGNYSARILPSESPSTGCNGNGSADLSKYSVCGAWKIYDVTPNLQLKLDAVTFECYSSACNDDSIDYYIDDRYNSEWNEIGVVNGPNAPGTPYDFCYTPKGSKIRIRSFTGSHFSLMISEKGQST